MAAPRTPQQRVNALSTCLQEESPGQRRIGAGRAAPADATLSEKLGGPVRPTIVGELNAQVAHVPAGEALSSSRPARDRRLQFEHCAAAGATEPWVARHPAAAAGVSVLRGGRPARPGRSCKGDAARSVTLEDSAVAPNGGPSA